MNLPYTYLIGWTNLNKWYYGCRIAKNCHPSDLWNPYKTSSKHVKSFIKEHGEPDIIKVRKTFTSVNECRKWEATVLKKMNAVKNNNWFNKFDGEAFDEESRSRGGRLGGKMGHEGKGSPGRPKSREHIEKMIKSKTGVKLNISPESHSKRMNGSLKSGNAAHRNKTGIHAWTNEQKLKHNKKAAKILKTLIQKFPEYRALHSMKIRYGRLKRRFNRVTFQEEDA